MSRPLAFPALLALGLLALPARAELADALRLFDAGNRHYAEGDYRGALDAYEQALATGYASGALYYNIGNAYYRLDELGQAIRYYEKARRLMPDHESLRHNLSLARSRTADTFSALPEPLWKPWWRRLVVRAGPLPFFTVGLLLYSLALALLAYRIWTGTRNDWHRRALALSAGAGLVLLALAFLASLDRTIDPQAVVVADRVALRAAPQPDAASELDLHEGVLLDVLRRRDLWLQVRLPNGVTGWVDAGATAEV